MTAEIIPFPRVVPQADPATVSELWAYYQIARDEFDQEPSETNGRVLIAACRRWVWAYAPEHTEATVCYARRAVALRLHSERYARGVTGGHES